MIPAHRVARIQDRIKESSSIDGAGCWIWQKARSRNGYGKFAFGKGHNVGAHRVAYEVFRSTPPAGMDVCHRCDVRSCVNPDHLFVGTRSENILDAVQKDRVSRTHSKRGSEHPSHKLSEALVSEILQRLSAGETFAKLGKTFGVSGRVISLISRGEAWAHVPRGTL